MTLHDRPIMQGWNPPVEMQATTALARELDDLRRRHAATERDAAMWAEKHGLQVRIAADWRHKAEKATAEVARLTAEVERLAKCENVVQQLVKAVDANQLEMNSPEIGEPEVGIPNHPWHEELLYYARAALSAAPATLAGCETHGHEWRGEYDSEGTPFQRCTKCGDST